MVKWDHKDPLELLVPQDNPVFAVRRVHKVCVVKLDQQDLLANKDHRDHLDQLDHRVPEVLLAKQGH